MSKKEKKVIEVNLPYGMPADVPQKVHQHYGANYYLLTRNTGRLLLFVADHKIEHLNQDFYGPDISLEILDPEHLFAIAASANIGGFATNFGLIARYGRRYPKINYVAKLNGKTNIVPTSEQDPLSSLLWSVDDVIAAKFDAQINICGIGITVYLGSTFEHEMLAQAAQAIYRAHAYGLATIVWVYPRGKAVADAKTPEMIAGAAGVGLALGADFVKVQVPHAPDQISEDEAITIACKTAKRTGVIFSGGPKVSAEQLLPTVANQLHYGASGCAVGRNLFQRSLSDAIALSNALAALVYENKTAEEALAIYQHGEQMVESQ